MGRSRSPLETAVYAFIGLWLLSRLLGVLFALSAAGGHGASALTLWAGASSALTYVLLGVEALILVLLVATERYWLAACMALVMGSGLIYQGLHRGPATANRRALAPSRAIDPYTGPAFDAAGTLTSLYAHLEEIRRGGLAAKQMACEEMSPGAQAEVVRAFGRGGDGVPACMVAIEPAARRGAFGRLPERTYRGYMTPGIEQANRIAIARSVVVSEDQRAAAYRAPSGVRFALARTDRRPPFSVWLVSGFTGGAFAGR